MTPEQLKRADEASVRLADEIERELLIAHGRGGVVAYLLHRAKVDAEAARDGLETVDPDDAKAIRQLQSAVRRRAELVIWMRQAIEEGDEAWNRLSPHERSEIVTDVAAMNDA